MELRDYQQDILSQVLASQTNDLVQLDTGAGKTPIEAALSEASEYSLLVAHRNILIQQISEKLAAFRLYHDTISTELTRRRCAASHGVHRGSFIRRGHPSRVVASIQSLLSARDRGGLSLDLDAPWVVIVDEAHHVTRENMWGDLVELLPNARFVGFTATPARLDGVSLHSSKGGLFDVLVQADGLRQSSVSALIEKGHLSSFKVYGPPGLRQLHRLNWETRVLDLWGDPVSEYKRLARGRRAVVMCPSIKNAEEYAEKFREAGVPSVCVSSTQSPRQISRTLDDFRFGRVDVLTNVDMVGEGFDLPACEVLIIATLTASFARYRQWCGRVLRPEYGKNGATIIDCSGMCAHHGSPDEHVDWDLLNPPKCPSHPWQVPCTECGVFFPVVSVSCPDCGADNEWVRHSDSKSPGSFYFDIRTLDYKALERGRSAASEVDMRERRETVLSPINYYFGPGLVGRSLKKTAEWFCDALSAYGVSILDVNDFIESSDCADPGFWIKNFTAADSGSDDSTKALKVYRTWLKSR